MSLLSHIIGIVFIGMHELHLRVIAVSMEGIFPAEGRIEGSRPEPFEIQSVQKIQLSSGIYALYHLVNTPGCILRAPAVDYRRR